MKGFFTTRKLPLWFFILWLWVAPNFSVFFSSEFRSAGCWVPPPLTCSYWGRPNPGGRGEGSIARSREGGQYGEVFFWDRVEPHATLGLGGRGAEHGEFHQGIPR